MSLFAPPATAQWREFRGPNADGNAAGMLPTRWSEDANVTWRKEIHGLGWSTPVCEDGKIWITTADRQGFMMSVLCLDYTNGDTLFDKILARCDNPEPILTQEPVNSYATSSAVLDGEGRIYVHFGSYGTFCIDTETYETLWQRRDLTCSHWRGFASSPVLWQDKLILTFDGADQQYLTALDKTTGRTVWRTDRSTVFADATGERGIPASHGDMRKSFSTPIIVTTGEHSVLISNAAKACWAYKPNTGEELWQVRYSTHSPSSRTVYSYGENLLFINTGLGKAEVWAVRLDPSASGDITQSHVVWKLLKGTPKRSSPVIAEGLLFFANDGVISCVDPKTSEVYWQERAGGDYSASLLAASGNVYFFDEKGLCTVVKASKSFEKVAENQLDAGFMASPAVFQDSLILRTRTHLYRIDRSEMGDF